MPERDRGGKEVSGIDFIRNARKAPEGVASDTFRFLRANFRLGKETVLNDFQRAIIAKYYATDMRLVEVTDDIKRKLFRTQLFAAMGKLWDSMPPEVREKFPKRVIKLLKQDDSSQTDEELAEEELFYGGKSRQIEKDDPTPRVYKTSPEHRRRISDALKGKKLSDVHRQRIGRGVARKWGDSEYREAVTESARARMSNVPQELRDKISAAQKKRWENRENS